MTMRREMTYELQGSGGSHMSATWDQAFELADESDVVVSYDMDTKEITWCDGTKSIPETPLAAISEINAMSAK